MLPAQFSSDWPPREALRLQNDLVSAIALPILTDRDSGRASAPQRFRESQVTPSL
jgi:hypothetical protein